MDVQREESEELHCEWPYCITLSLSGLSLKLLFPNTLSKNC
jgi:hypothetical protein